MHTEIYYFSGTGNSLYMAKELQNRLPHSTLIPMASLMRQDVIRYRRGYGRARIPCPCDDAAPGGAALPG